MFQVPDCVWYCIITHVQLFNLEITSQFWCGSYFVNLLGAIVRSICRMKFFEQIAKLPSLYK